MLVYGAPDERVPFNTTMNVNTSMNWKLKANLSEQYKCLGDYPCYIRSSWLSIHLVPFHVQCVCVYVYICVCMFNSQWNSFLQHIMSVTKPSSTQPTTLMQEISNWNSYEVCPLAYNRKSFCIFVLYGKSQDLCVRYVPSCVFSFELFNVQ